LKTILISLSVLLYTGCAVTPFPDFPELSVKKQYTLIINDMALSQELDFAITNKEEFYYNAKQVNCLEFEVLSVNPYKVKFIKDAQLEDCHLVTGFHASKTKTVFKWVEDIFDWAKDRKKCFKE